MTEPLQGLPGLVARLPELQAAYRTASPWPHLVLDGLVAPALLRAAEAESRTVDPSSMISVPTRRQRKRETGDPALLGPSVRRLLEALEGPEWTAFVSRLTGVGQLVADPSRFAAGLHETAPGGYTLVHTDFSTHPTTGLHHRTNTLLYLNEGWQDAWGGSLELWPTSMRAVGRRVLPQSGTVVVWETGPHTPHALPEPVASPDGRSRLALAAYHYAPVPAGGVPRGRTATFLRRPQDPWWVGLPTYHDLRRRLRPR
ncbi:MAG: hypothetical protein JWN17_2557 [Frankiales bacterium]|nr:hypothetical protein [Frankiales bacterium]